MHGCHVGLGRLQKDECTKRGNDGVACAVGPTAEGSGPAVIDDERADAPRRSASAVRAEVREVDQSCV